MDRSILGKNISEFDDVDPFNNGNRVQGVVCHDSDEHYGALFIETVNNEPHPQLVLGTPKMRYPFDKQGTYRFPAAKYIEVFEKLDGTNVLAYRYTDGDRDYLTFKTRLQPFLHNGRFGPFLDLWNEVARQSFVEIEREMLRSECNLSFELYGSRNTHLIVYDEPLAFRLLFGIKKDGVILSPTQLRQPDLPIVSLRTTIDREFQAEYQKNREILQGLLRATEDEHYKGEEGSVWYCHLVTDTCVQLKCKPESVEAIHFASGAHISRNSIMATVLNATEDVADISYEYVVTLLAEEYDQHEIEMQKDLITACISEVSQALEFKNKVLDVYRHLGLDIASNKQAVMRAMSEHFPRNIMGRVYSIITGAK